jgi:hypothetical protein
MQRGSVMVVFCLNESTTLKSKKMNWFQITAFYPLKQKLNSVLSVLIPSQKYKLTGWLDQYLNLFLQELMV